MAQWDLTYYIRDAQGNHLTTIGRKMTETDEYEATDELNITETILYGSDRLGSRGWEPSDDGQPASLIGRHAFTHSGASTEGEYQDITLSGSPVYSTAPENYFSSLEGAKHYELKNHLGNVLATVSDKRDVEVDGSYNVESYTAKVSDVSFYYPFGSLMPGLSDFGGEHRYGFNGQEDVYEVKNTRSAHKTALFWEYDTRLARRWNLDPKPYAQRSNYLVFSNSPILFVDPLGDDDYYNMAGKWIGSDGQGTAIRIIGTQTTSSASFKEQLDIGGIDYVRKHSREVTVQGNVTEHLNTLYSDSYKAQKEKTALFVLDTKAATLSIVNQPEHPMDTRTQSITEVDKVGELYSIPKGGDNNQVVVGQIHTHPDDKANSVPPGSTGFSTTFTEVKQTTSERDKSAAQDLQIPVHGIDGTGAVHQVLPNGDKTDGLENNQDLLIKSLEANGGKPKI